MYLNDFTSQKICTALQNRPLTFNRGVLCDFESTCGFVNVKLVIVDLLGGGAQQLRCGLITL